MGIGNAGGTGGTPSAAGGTVTALNQSITASDDGDGTSEQLSGLIETNADIQPGDSGGVAGQHLGRRHRHGHGRLGRDSRSNTTGSHPRAARASPSRSTPRSPSPSTIEEGSGSSTVHIGETAFLGVEINAQSSSSGDSAPVRVAAASEASSEATPAAPATRATPARALREPRSPARSRMVPPRKPACPVATSSPRWVARRSARLTTSPTPSASTTRATR